MKNQTNFSQTFQNFLLKRPNKVKEKNQAAYVSIGVIIVIGIFLHGSWIFLFWKLGVKPLALYNCISVSLFLSAFFLNRRGFHLSASALGCFEVCIHQALCVILVGWNAGFQYYLYIAPVTIFLSSAKNNFIKIIIVIISLLEFLLLDYFFKNADPIFDLPIMMLQFFNYSGIISVGIIIGSLSYFFRSQIHITQKALREEQNKVKKAYGLLSKYVPSQVTDTILNGQVESVSTHHRKKLTLFFSDIKDFTKMTDALEPEDMAKILNEYLTEMNKIINKYKGTLAQVIGDGLYIFFGAPKESNDKDHAFRCIKMAIDMQIKMKELNKKWFSLGIDTSLKIRCGINTGMATVGGYGSSERIEYTAMGMQVNIAARLESACIPGKILINHTTWVLVKDDIPFLEKGKIEIKGYHLPLKVYEVQI